MAIKKFDPSGGFFAELTSETSGVKDNTNPQVNQKLNTIDFTTLYLNRGHFITEQDLHPDLVDKIWTALYEGTSNTNVRVHHVVVYEQVMEGNPYKVLTLKLLATADSPEGKLYRLYNINRETYFDINDYIDIEIDNKDFIPSDIFKKLESHGIVLALELTKENKYVFSLTDNHDKVGFKVGYNTTRDKSGIIVRTDLTAYQRNYKFEPVDVNNTIQGFNILSDAYTGVMNAAAFSETLANEVTKGILLLIYELFSTYTDIKPYFTIGTSANNESSYVSFYIDYRIEQTLEKGDRGSGKITFNSTGHKTISFSVDKSNREQILSMIKSFEALRSKLLVNKYGYNPAKLDRDIEEKIIKDFTNIVDVVSAYRLL